MDTRPNRAGPHERPRKLVDLLDALTDQQLREVIQAAQPKMPSAVAFAFSMLSWNIGAVRARAREWAQDFDDFRTDLDETPWLKDIISAAMDRVRTKHFGG